MIVTTPWKGRRESGRMKQSTRVLLGLSLAGAATYACMLLALAPVAAKFRSPILRRLFFAR